MVYIYALKLENNKYYIGKTNNPDFRIENHFNSEGSAWTKKYKPIELVELIKDCDNYDEDKYTIKYMEKYGVTNVRGGSFCEIRLSESNKSTLDQMITSCSDKCFICGRSGHYANNCYAKTHINGESLYDESDTEYEEIWCCGYCDKEFSTNSSCLNHQKLCKHNINKKNNCYRCGRSGHYANECYAKTNKYGYYLDEDDEDDNNYDNYDD